MQRLNRSITSDGVDYHPGTPVSDLPPRIRDSVVESGWADDVPAETSSRKSVSPRPAAGRGAGGEGPTAPPARADPAPASADPAPASADPAPSDSPADKPAPRSRPSRAKPKT